MHHTQIERAKATYIPGVTIEVTPIGFQFQGQTYRLRSEISEAKGSWTGEKWVIEYKYATSQAIDKLLDATDAYSKRLATSVATIKNAVASGKQWLKLDV